jgi:hypothetical protein
MRPLRACCVFVLLALLGACADEHEREREAVDLILHNGIVLTLDSGNRHGSALAIRDGLIVAVGDERLLQTYDADDTHDLAGHALMPGFIDSHVHVGGTPKRHLDLRGARSLHEIRAQIAARAAELEAGEWITGSGWSDELLEEGRSPLGRDLDEAAPDNPVVLIRAGGRSAIASSRALGLAGIDAQTRDREGGRIERDRDGKPTGVIHERPDLVARLVPKTSDAELRPSFVAALRALFQFGITSIIQTDDTVGHYAEWERVYARERGTLPRASVEVAWEGDEVMAAFGRRSGDGDEHLRVGAVNVVVDGDFAGPSAWTHQPYRDMNGYRGALAQPARRIYRVVRDAHRAGWQLGLQTTGDAAIELAAEALSDVLAETPRDDHRHYLSHFTLLPPTETLGRLSAERIAITQQPNLTYVLDDRYAAHLDDGRLAAVNPLRTPLNHGIRIALSSDGQPAGPFVGIHAAVTRKGASGRQFGQHERISVLEALRAYTAGGAWLTREETLKGTLEPGKLADFIVLSHNPLTVTEDELPAIRVLGTWLGGELVWSQPEEGDSA